MKRMPETRKRYSLIRILHKHPWLRNPGGVIALALFLIPLLWFPTIHGNDGVRNYAYCRSLWMDGDFDFSNEFDHYRKLGEMDSAEKTGMIDPVTGKPGNPLGIGSALLWSPFFLSAHVYAKTAGIPADGYSRPYAWAVSLGSTLYAILGLALLTWVLARRFGGSAMRVAVFSVWLGSPLVFYMYLHPSMSHANSFFLACLLVWIYERWREHQSLWHFLFAGYVGGLAIVTRFSDTALLLLPLAFWLRTMVTGRMHEHHMSKLRSRKPRLWLALALLAIGLGVALGMLPQLFAWRSIYGNWLAGPRSYGLAQNFAPFWTSPHLFVILFSGWRGLFVWSPTLILGAIGFGLLLFHHRHIIDWALFLAFAVQLWVIGGWSVWWGGASLGQRFFIDLLPLFALGTAALYRSLPHRALRRGMLVLIALCLLWSTGLAVQYISGMISREQPVTVRQLAENQRHKVPQWIANHARLLLPGARLSTAQKEPRP